MAGNTLGNRAKFLYVTDSGVSVRLNTDEDLGNAGGLPIALPGSDAVTAPKGFKPRGVHCQAVVGAAQDGSGGYLARKFLPCGATSGLYASDLPQNVVIDGTTFVTTGRRGETQRFI